MKKILSAIAVAASLLTTSVFAQPVVVPHHHAGPTHKQVHKHHVKKHGHHMKRHVRHHKPMRHHAPHRSPVGHPSTR